MRKTQKLFLFIISSLLISCPLFPFELPIVYLTWKHRPESTMVIRWITDSDHTDDQIFYKKVGTDFWQRAVGNHVSLPDDHTEYLIHTVQLEGLSSDTEYRFHLDTNEKEYGFETMPNSLEKPIRFVVGGDFYHDDLETLIEMNKIAASLYPNFALVGGDIAYSGYKDVSKLENLNRWLDFLDAWNKTMVTPKGNHIPLLAAIGNHDVKGFYFQTPQQAPFFYELFLLPGERSYRVLDFNSHMSIWFLDTNHTFPIEGKQSQWLASTLQKRENQLYKFGIYHVPAFPSVRSFYERESKAVRAAWVPLFEKFGLNAAFENHDHAYKRTHFIKKHRSDPTGVLYIGDGGWGVKHPRNPHSPLKRGYLAKSTSKRNLVVATITKDFADFKAVDSSGDAFDQVLVRAKQQQKMDPMDQMDLMDQMDITKKVSFSH